MDSRERADKTVLSIEAALYNAAHDFRGGVEALAPLMAANPQVLRNKLNLTQSTHHPTLRDFRNISELTQDLRILQSVCSWFGAAYFILPEVHVDDGALFERSGDVVREMGEMMATVTSAVSDGCVDPDEIAALDKALLEFVAVSKALIETAKTVGKRK